VERLSVKSPVPTRFPPEMGGAAPPVQVRAGAWKDTALLLPPQPSYSPDVVLQLSCIFLESLGRLHKP
jgi:hypothetical protein